MTLSAILVIVIGAALIALGAFGCWLWLKIVARCIDRHERLSWWKRRQHRQSAVQALSEYRESSPLPVHDTEGGCYESQADPSYPREYRRGFIVEGQHQVADGSENTDPVVKEESNG